MTKIKLPTPTVKLRNLKLNDIPSLRVPNYRQVMDLILAHIEENNLQDPFQRNKIRLDPIFKNVFKEQLIHLRSPLLSLPTTLSSQTHGESSQKFDESLSFVQVQELPTLVRLFLSRMNTA